MDQPSPNVYVENENLKSEASFFALGIFGGIVVILVLFFTLNYFNILSLSTIFSKQLGWLPHQRVKIAKSYVFIIESNFIPQDQFVTTYTYFNYFYKNREKSLQYAKALFVANNILRKDYVKAGYSLDDLARLSTKSQTVPKTSQTPDKLSAENAYLKKFLFSQSTITWRTGEVLLARTRLTNDQDSARITAQRKLNFYKAKFDNGTTFTDIRQLFLNDSEITKLNGGQSGLLSFNKATPEDPQILDNSFKKTVFTLQPRQMSNILSFTDDKSKTWAYALIYASDGANGIAESYEEYISSQTKLLNIKTNFEEIQ